MAKAKQSEEYKTKTTTAHQEIRRWVEERGGNPARVEGTQLLRIDYPGFSGEQRLEQISWDEFFEVFDKNNLAFIYQEETKDGGESRFSKFVDRDSLEE
jgi:anaerobic selenocysteine-containing dehydrogenase